MSKGKQPGMTRQVKNILDSKLAIGQSKYKDKALNLTAEKIYSWSTYQGYLDKCCKFSKWAKDTYGAKTIDEARQYVDEYLKL